MRKIILVAILCFAYNLNAQTFSYNDIGLLFSKENINGTARFNSMSGAFGALGGDLSAIEINPAGAAVFTNSEFSTSLSIRNSKIISAFYGNNEITDNDYANLSQAGGVFVFEGGKNSNWGKIAFGFNYSVINDFENFWLAKGNSGAAPLTDIYDPDVTYNITDGQYFESFTKGKNNKYSFTFATQNSNNLFLGASINTYDVEYYQNALLEEYNSDDTSNTFDISQFQDLLTYGEGISISLGLISKLSNNLRLGLAYQSPVWYNLSEESIKYDVDMYENDLNITNEFNSEDTYSGVNFFDYRLKTPSKLTGSFADIFDKIGLISIDYTHKNYSNIKISNTSFNNENFTEENMGFKETLKSTGEFKIGTEWRFDNFSLRGGYHFEMNPYSNAIDSDNLEGFSLGAGVKHRNIKFDISYQKNNNTASYNFYPEYNLNSSDLNFDTSKITATFVLSL